MSGSDAGGFSLQGGPLHELGRRLGLVRGTNTVRLGLAIGIGLWLIIVALALMEGVIGRLFEMSVVGGHARLLLVIPLFFACESWVDPRMAAFVGTIARTGIVPLGQQPVLDAEVARTGRRCNWWVPEVVFLLVAILLDVAGVRLQTYGETGAYNAARTALPGVFYFRVGLAVFHFLLLRWVWKLALWCWFLWRVSRLDLHLLAGHPDRAGGLGPLAGIHERFTPLVAALSVLESASLAESISTGALSATAVYPTLSLLLIVDGVLFLAPLLVFTDKLWAGRSRGVGAYMGFAARYVADFEAKWISGVPAEPALGTADVQALADLAIAIGVVKSMRWITVGPRLLTLMSVAAFVPLAPLLLFQYPLAELAQKFFARMVGL